MVQHMTQLHYSFPRCGNLPLGLYPIVDSFQWVEKLLPTGVTTLQLRIKNKDGSALEKEIRDSIALATHYKTRLFINDAWELAIRHHAYGVHLGQEDLNNADIEKIYNAGLRLGISTHSDAEITHALLFKPSYLAFGPVFPTTSKIIAAVPQGLEHLKRHQQRILNYPLVAIGGINHTNLADVIATNVNGVAMISAITHAEDPIATTKKFLEMFNKQAQPNSYSP
jgi:thiamine-phosphate diphosphorylase